MAITGQSLTRIYDQPNHPRYKEIQRYHSVMKLLGLEQYDARFTVVFGLRTWDFLMAELMDAPIYAVSDIQQLMMQRMLEIIWPRAAAERFHFIESGNASR